MWGAGGESRYTEARGVGSPEPELQVFVSPPPWEPYSDPPGEQLALPTTEPPLQPLSYRGCLSSKESLCAFTELPATI